MKNLVVYVHGKGGSAEEAERYKTLFPSHEVIGFDYRSQTPWEAKKEFFTEQRNRREHLTLVANSIGAFFALSSLDETLVDNTLFISPVVDMEALICNMGFNSVLGIHLFCRKPNSDCPAFFPRIQADPLHRSPPIRNATTICQQKKPSLMG